MSREMLAQIADHLAVLASNHRYKEPVRIPRPDYLDKATDKPAERPKPSSPEEIAAFFRPRHARAAR